MSDQQTTTRRFNPGTFQSDAAVKKQFVVRHDEFNRVMEVLKNNIEAESCRHLLLIGSRGQGKTMLLARTRSELRTRKTLAKRLLPVWFMEESHEIWDLADFWLETMAYLAAAVEDKTRAEDLRATHRRLAESDAGTKAVAREARDAVLEAAAGRKLVLMVENLDALCDAMAGRGRIRRPGIGWLRETLEKCADQVMVLATATRPPTGVGPRQKFFEIVNLPPLTPVACRKLLRSLGQQDRKDAKALQILTGGNPRMLGIVASFVHKVSLDQLAEDMVSLIDEHTEYFRGYLENFAQAERRVFVALADLWAQATAKEVATRARMDNRTVSALLGRLVDRGTVAKDKGDDGKWRYQINMRLVSIYYKLRRTRDSDVFVTSLFRFMAAYYSDVALEMFDAEAQTEFSPEARREIDSIMAGAINEAARTRGAPRDVLADCDEIFKRWAAYDSPGEDMRAELVEAYVLKGFAHCALGDSEAALLAWSDAVETAGASEKPAADSEEPATREKIQEQVAWALIGRGEAHRMAGSHDEALASYGKAIGLVEEARAPRLRLQLGRALLLRGALQRELASDGADAKTSFECACRALDVESGVGERLAWYAVVCLAALDSRVDHDYTEQVYKPVVEQLRQDSPTSGFSGSEEVAESTDQVGWYSKWFRAQSLFALGQDAAALETFRQAYASYDPKDSRFISDVFKLVDQVAAANSDDLLANLREVLASDKEKAEQLRPLTFALDAGAARKQVQASVEMIEVAKDIQARIAGTRARRNGSSWLGAVQEAAKGIAVLAVQAREEAERWKNDGLGRKR